MSNRHSPAASQSISFNDIAQIVVQSRVSKPATEVPEPKNFGGLILQEWETVNAAVNAIKRRGGAVRSDGDNWNDMTIKIFVTLDNKQVAVEQWYFGWLGTPAINERQRVTMYKALYTHLRVLPLYWMRHKKLPRLHFSYKVFAGPPNRPLSKNSGTEIFHVQRRSGQLRLSYDFEPDVGDLVHNNLSKQPELSASIKPSTPPPPTTTSHTSHTTRTPVSNVDQGKRRTVSTLGHTQRSPQLLERERDRSQRSEVRDIPRHNALQQQQQHRTHRMDPQSQPVDIPRGAQWKLDQKHRASVRAGGKVGGYSMQHDSRDRESRSSPQAIRHQQTDEEASSLPSRLRTIDADYRFPFAPTSYGSPSSLSNRSPSDRGQSSLTQRAHSHASHGSGASTALRISYLNAGGSPQSGPRSLTDSQHLSVSSREGSVHSDSENEDVVAMMEIPHTDTMEELPFAMDDGDELESFVQQFNKPLALSMFSSRLDPRESIARLDNNIDASRNELEQFNRSVARH